MAEATSSTTGARYGVARVCQIWDQPRSSFYAARQPQVGAVAPASASARRGPEASVGDRRSSPPSTPTSSDPMDREGHRKVWAGSVRSMACGVTQTPAAVHARAWPALAHRARTRSDARTMADRRRGGRDVGDDATNRHRPGRQSLAVRRRQHWTPSCSVVSPSAGPASKLFRPSAWRCETSSTASTPAPPAAWRCGMITAATSCRTLSRNRSAPGASRRATPSSESRKPMASSSACSEPSRSRSCTDVSSRRRRRPRRVRAFAARYNAEWLIEKNGHRSPDDARAAWHDHPFRRAA